MISCCPLVRTMGWLMTSVGLSTACHADPAKLRMSLAHRETRRAADVSAFRETWSAWGVRRRGWALAAAAALCVWIAWVGAIGSRFEVVAGGADSSGYLNGARLLAAGRASTDLRLPEEVRGVARPNEFMPLGFTLGRREGEAVPTYPPGLPLQFALAAVVFGWNGGPWVVSLALAALLPLLMVRAARELGVSRPLAWAGAVVLMASPVTLFGALQPLSDLPAAVWSLGALSAALRATRREAGCSSGGASLGWSMTCGVAVAMAVAIRPTSALIIPALVLILGCWRGWLGAALGGLPGALALGAYQGALYGHPLATGYGNILAALGPEWIGITVRSYAEWLPRVLPGVVGVLPVVGVFFLREPERRRRMLGLIVWVVTVAGFYATYPVTHEVWWCLRFLLPAFPALVERTEGKGPMRWGMAGALTLALWAVALSWLWVPRLHLTAIGPAERVYRDAGRWVAGNLPPQAVVSSFAASGALYYYSPMSTLRFDDLRPGAGPEIVRRLHAAGRPVFALVFEAERPSAQERLGVGRWVAVRNWGGLQLWRVEPDA